MAIVEDKQEVGITCPQCGCPETHVLQTRRRVLVVNGRKCGGIRRERECDHCKKRFWTTEAMS